MEMLTPYTGLEQTTLLYDRHGDSREANKRPTTDNIVQL